MRFWLVLVVLFPFISGCISIMEGTKGVVECPLEHPLRSSTCRISVYDTMSCIESLFEMDVRRDIDAVSTSNGIWNANYSVRVVERCVVLGSNSTVVAKVNDWCQIASNDLFSVIIDNTHVSFVGRKANWEEPLYSPDPPRLVLHYLGGLEIVNHDDEEGPVSYYDLLRPSSVTTLWEAIKREAVVD